MTAIDTVVIGAGHAGLAVSHLMGKVGRDHVVLDRGRVAESWRSERWDSLRLLTPRWMTRLPGRRHLGADQEGFMAVPELVDYLEGYAADSGAPLELGHEVLEVSQFRGRYQVVTSAGSWLAQNVVVATGPTGRHAPAPRASTASTPTSRCGSSAYRNPHQLPAGGVLVVGASASGTQIADELVRAGRRVVLAVGSHTRMPRRYRGMDAFWWMEQTGKLARVDDGRAIAPNARREPSLQMAGREPERPPRRRPRPDDAPGRRRRAGRPPGPRAPAPGRLPARPRRGPLVRRTPGSPGCSTSSTCTSTPTTSVTRSSRASGHVPSLVRRTRTRIDLRAEGIGTVVLATGFRPHHPWLNVPVVAPDGRIRQYRGVTPRRACTPSASGSSTAATRRSSTARGSTHDDVVSHLCTGEFGALERAGRVMTRLRRRRRRRPGRRRLDRDAAGPGRRSGSRVLDRGKYGTDTLSTHALMRAGVLQLSRWGLLPRIVEAGHPPVPVVTFLYDGAGAGADLDPPERRRRRAVRAPPVPARPDPGRRRGRGRRGGPARDPGPGPAP